MRLAIITTHPIQYYAPVFKLLSQCKNINIKVFYTSGKNTANKYDPGFNKNITWDIPLLEGYEHEFINNTSKNNHSYNFKAIINPDLISKLNDYGPDKILVYGWAYQSHLKVIRYFKNKVPVFFRGDSTLLDNKKGIKTLARALLLRWVYRHIDHAFYVGTNNKAYYKKYGLTDSQLTFAPHAINNARFKTDRTEEVKLLRQQLNINDNDILVLFAGKFEDKKDPLLLLRAFVAINKPDTHLLFVGDGILRPVLTAAAKGIANIHFIGFQNQTYMPVIYQACNLFCLPSKGPAETWGLAINEAMACKKPILTSDKTGCAIDLVKPGYNGIIFKAGDLTDLINNLMLLIDKGKAGLSQMGEHSAEIIKNWSFKNQVDSIEHVINEK